jgi:hypothetical protein
VSNQNFIAFKLSKFTYALIGISCVPLALAVYGNEPEESINQKIAGVVMCVIAGILIDLVFWFARNWDEH